MNRIFLIVYIISMLVFGYWAAESFRQERAKMKYSNPKYIRDVTVFTGRKSRNDPYLTNMTGTILKPYGNNVTVSGLKELVDKYQPRVAVVLTLKSGGDFKFANKVCDSFKNKWMNEFMSSFTNLTFNKCPLPVARYTYINMELPPKNIPVPIADGDHLIRFQLYITSNKEPILEIETLLHFDHNARKTKAKKGKKN